MNDKNKSKYFVFKLVRNSFFKTCQGGGLVMVAYEFVAWCGIPPRGVKEFSLV
jgi:hypothetical protein